MAKKKKYYVVWKGMNPGIYESWDECKRQIQGFEGAVYKSFPSKRMAEEAYYGHADDYIGKRQPKADISDEQKKLIGEPEKPSIAVDAACSGNPGIMEYQGVNTADGKPIFHQGPFPDATVNIGEFLAIVHALALLKNKGKTTPIYSDSMTAISWVKKKKANTQLQRTAKNGKVFEMIQRAEKWLHNNSFENRILKWQTKYWGEIPADFGRK